MSELRGASRNAVAALRDRLEALVRDGAQLAGVGDELFAVVGLLDSQQSLRRALTDAARTGSDRAGLAADLLGGQVGATASDLIGTACRQQWAGPRDLANGLEELAVLVEIRTAEQQGRLDELEDELFRFGRVVRGNGPLRAALTDRMIPAERRQGLVETLLDGKATEQTVRLAVQASTAPRGLTLMDALDRYARAAADWRQRLVALVHSAVALTGEERRRLGAALERAYGHEVHLNVVVDPSLLGGLRVQVGEEVIDGSVASRLDEASRRMAR